MATKQKEKENNGGASASLFSTDLGLLHRPPHSPLRRLIWRWRIWFESTFALTMFEGWEKILILALMAIFWGLLITGIYRYLPYHLLFLYRRAVYYLSGTEQKDWTSAGGAGAAMLSTKTPHVFTAEL